MRRRLPVAADVRRAIEDTRRAARLPAGRVVEAVQSVSWSRIGEATCHVCGEDGPAVRAAGARTVIVCERTLGELLAEMALPTGTSTEAVLDVLERWMAPQPGEPEAGPMPEPPPSCATCGRPGAEVARIAAGADAALCGDCIERGARECLDEATRAHFLAAEAQQARLELEDLDRLRATEPAARLRSNPTLALSLVRLLCVPDEAVRRQLVTFVENLDGG